VTGPIWSWQKRPDALQELQLRLCHTLDLEFLERIPVLTMNDWECKQKMDECLGDFQSRIEAASPETGKVAVGVREAFQKHGIFALIILAKNEDLKVISLFLCLEPDRYSSQRWLQAMLKISRSYISTILRRLREWGLIKAYKTNVKGRARGRQLLYMLDAEVRRLLDQNLKDCDFFCEAVVQTVKPIAETYTEVNWRKDVLWPDRQVST